MEAEASGGDVAAYELPAVFGPTASQEEVYAFVRPVVLSFLGGYHGTVFAYGQTGAGKTHTMQGPRHQPGVVPRALADLFTHLAAAKAKAGVDGGQTAAVFEAVVTLSYLELYNEDIIDLFDPSLGEGDPYSSGGSFGDAASGGEQGAPQVLTIRDNAGPVAVDGLRSVTVSSAKEAAAALAAGERRRHVAATALNRASSRSHAVLCVRLDVAITPLGGDATRRSSQLTLVDLAGSERASTRSGGLAHGASGVTSAWLEGTHINLGLLSLGRVVRALAATKGSATRDGQQHVPWRDSKLTRLLAGALGGNSKACALCCCSPAPSCAADTRNTLRFAERCALVTTRAVLNEHLGLAAQLAQAKLEIGKLRQQLAAATQAAAATQRRRPGSTPGATRAELPVGPAEAHLLASQDEEMARLSAELAHERRARADAEARLGDAMQRLGVSGHGYAAISTPVQGLSRPVVGDRPEPGGVRPLAAASGAVDAVFADLRAAQQVLAHVRADVARAATPPASGSGGRGGSSRSMSADLAPEARPVPMASWASDSPPAKASIRLQDLVPADQFWAATLHDAALAPQQQPVRGDAWQGGVDGAAPGDMRARAARDSLWVSPHWPQQQHAGGVGTNPW